MKYLKAALLTYLTFAVTFLLSPAWVQADLTQVVVNTIADVTVFSGATLDELIRTKSDASRILIYGGSVLSNSNGASLDLNGNTFSGSAGNAFLSSSTASASGITINAKGSSGTILFKTANATAWTMDSTGTLVGAGTGSIGWSVVAGANTACTTTCTTPCVFGWDAGTTTIVDCASALADKCVCAGAN